MLPKAPFAKRSMTLAAVDIAGLADGGVDLDIAQGIDLFDLAEQEARHIEIVDHHVHQQPAGDLDVVDRRRRWVAADDRQRMRLADFAAHDRPFQARVIGVKAPIEADLQLHARFGDSRQRRINLGQVKSDGLLAENLLARPRRLDDETAMGIGRRANDDCVNVGAAG